MKLGPRSTRQKTLTALGELREGLSYVFSHSIIRTLIVMAIGAGLLGMSYATLMPAWAVKILHGTVKTNGMLQSARAAGSLVGALTIASLGQFRFKGRLITLGSFLFPILLLAFSVVRREVFSLLILLGLGWSTMIVFNLMNTVIQTLVSDDLRGRVMSIYSLVFFGSMPLGSLLIGTAAEKTSEPIALACGALLCLVMATGVWMRVPGLRSVE